MLDNRRRAWLTPFAGYGLVLPSGKGRNPREQEQEKARPQRLLHALWAPSRGLATPELDGDGPPRSGLLDQARAARGAGEVRRILHGGLHRPLRRQPRSAESDG